jgi:ferric iron reductase protein FhuF
MDADGPAREVLDDGAAWGERFVAPVGAPTGPGWVAAAELFGPGLDDALARLAAARDTANPAVAGSLLVETYAQRLVAPVLGAWFVDGRVLDARLSRVRAERVDPGVRRVAFLDPPVTVADPDDAVRRLLTCLVEGNLQVAARAVHERTRLGWRVLHGAIAHAIAISFLHLSWPRPDHDRHVDDARDFLAGVPGLAELVEIEAVAEGGRPWMSCDRNTCCLAFRTVGGRSSSSTCALCPLRPRAETRAMFAQATASYTERHPDL